MSDALSSAYSYVVFLPGKQPTVEEIAQLDQWCEATKQTYTAGVNAEDGCLALVFHAAYFDIARVSDERLIVLLERWQVRGSRICERIRFIKNPLALQPIPGDMLSLVERQNQPSLIRKQGAAQQAMALASLKLQRTLERHAWVQRIAKVIPYSLMALMAVLTISAGVYFGYRLLDADAERRRDTIQRVSSDAMNEPLTRQASEDPTSIEPPNADEPQPEQ